MLMGACQSGTVWAGFMSNPSSSSPSGTAAGVVFSELSYRRFALRCKGHGTVCPFSFVASRRTATAQRVARWVVLHAVHHSNACVAERYSGSQPHQNRSCAYSSAELGRLLNSVGCAHASLADCKQAISKVRDTY